MENGQTKKDYRMTEQVIILGQTVMRFDTPQFVIDEANRVYDHRKENELPPTNKFLAGKIRNEHTLYHNELNNNDSFIFYLG